MSADREFPPEDGDAALERALEWVPRPAPRVEFRVTLRERFVVIASERTAPRAPVAPAVLRERRPRIWSGLLAAAALLVAFGLWWRSQVPEWRLVEGGGAQLVSLDGSRHDLEPNADLGELFENGGTLESGASELIVRLGDTCVAWVGPAALLRFAPRKREKGPLEIEVVQGNLCAVTGPAIKERAIEVKTARFVVDVVGTRIAVDYVEAGICICCVEGQIDVRGREDGYQRHLKPGDMTLATPGTGYVEGGLQPTHIAPLEALTRRAEAIWR